MQKLFGLSDLETGVIQYFISWGLSGFMRVFRRRSKLTRRGWRIDYRAGIGNAVSTPGNGAGDHNASCRGQLARRYRGDFHVLCILAPQMRRCYVECV